MSPPSSQPWWHAPLTAGQLAADPLLSPWDDSALLAALAEAFADPALYELACGLGAAPSADYLRKVMSGPADIHLWRPRPQPPAPGIGSLWVHSAYTSLHRVWVWSPTAAPAEGPWAAAIESLAAAVLAHEGEAEYVFVHLAAPAEIWQETALLRAGFDPFDTDDDYKPPPREIYGISRAAHQQVHAED